MIKKLKIGIDIDEVLRAKWIQFDRYYNQEFGDEGVPEQPYVFDYFNEYTWNAVVEKNKELIEDETILENINPLDYVLDENGKSVADLVLFNNTENSLTSIDVYNRFMYEDYRFEIFANSPIMYKNFDTHFNEFQLKFNNYFDMVIVSNENKLTIPSTLFFLSKLITRAREYNFTNVSSDKWNNVDVLITADPEILNKPAPRGKKIIRIERPFNIELNKNSFISTIQLFELYNNEKFKKLINYKDE